MNGPGNPKFIPSPQIASPERMQTVAAFYNTILVPILRAGGKPDEVITAALNDPQKADAIADIFLHTIDKDCILTERKKIPLQSEMPLQRTLSATDRQKQQEDTQAFLHQFQMFLEQYGGSGSDILPAIEKGGENL